MEKKNQWTKEEAQLLKSGQGLSAGIWLQAGDTPSKLFPRLPDPAFSISKDWPDFDLPPADVQSLPVSNEPTATSPTTSITREKPAVPEHIELLKAPTVQPKPDVIHETTQSPHPMKDKKSEKKKKDSSMEGSGLPESGKLKAEKKPKAKKKPLAATEEKGLDFYHWLDALGAKKSSKKSGKTNKAAGSERSAAVLSAENSLKLGAAIVSETLAKLLVRQGHKEDAIAMYEKLIQKYPQKEATFAAAIEKLKS